MNEEQPTYSGGYTHSYYLRYLEIFYPIGPKVRAFFGGLISIAILPFRKETVPAVGPKHT